MISIQGKKGRLRIKEKRKEEGEKMKRRQMRKMKRRRVRKMKRRQMRKMKRRQVRKMRNNLSDFLPLTIRLFHSSFVSVCGSIFPFFHSLSVSFFLYFYLSFVSFSPNFSSLKSTCISPSLSVADRPQGLNEGY